MPLTQFRRVIDAEAIVGRQRFTALVQQTETRKSLCQTRVHTDATIADGAVCNIACNERMNTLQASPTCPNLPINTLHISCIVSIA